MFGSPAHRERLKLVVIDKTEYLYLPRTLAAHVDKERYMTLDAIRKNEEKFTKCGPAWIEAWPYTYDTAKDNVTLIRYFEMIEELFGGSPERCQFEN